MDNQNQRVTEQATDLDKLLNQAETTAILGSEKHCRDLLMEIAGQFTARLAEPRVTEQAEDDDYPSNHAAKGFPCLCCNEQAAPEAPTGFEQAIGAWLSARDYWQDEENEHVKAAWSNVLKFAAPAPATQQAGAAPYSAPFTTDVPQCCEDPENCAEPCIPAATTASTDPFAEADARPPNIHRRLVFALFPVATTASASKCRNCDDQGFADGGGCAYCGRTKPDPEYIDGRAPAPSQEAALLDWTEERITELAKSMAVEVAKNCSTVPQLTFPHIYLGLKEALAQQGAAQAKSVCRNCADFGWEPSISGERRPCEFCKPGAAQAAHAGAVEKDAGRWRMFIEILVESGNASDAKQAEELLDKVIVGKTASLSVIAAIAASQPQKGSQA